MNSIIVKAPAKVNLFLKVLGKRKDSYHDILTVFERISLADTIRISKIPEGIIVRSDILITRDPEDNIVYKAAKTILKRGKIKSGVKIEIKKRVPIAAGLGGGSSDAAAVLKGINKLFRLRLGDKALLGAARELGADVPFFVLDTAFAVGRGRGDELKVIKSRSRFWHLIIKAGFKIATKDIYEAFDAGHRSARGRLTLQGRDARIFFRSLSQMDHAKADSMLYNDLERAVSLKDGAIDGVLKSLAQLLGKNMIISGSGPSLFCLYRTRREAVKARGLVLKSVPKLKRSDWRIFIAETCG
jgi:4-diphosphocytidyl-2-C-methyl-D-erythritol kinase